MLHIGMKGALRPYCPFRVYKDELKSLLTPGEYVDWMCLNLYIQLLVNDQDLKAFKLGHVPWDMVDTYGLSSSSSVTDVMDLFSQGPFQYPAKWVRIAP